MHNKHINKKHNEPQWKNLDDFTKPNGAFHTSKAGTVTFVPLELPPAVTYDHELIRLLITAERKVGELKGMGGTIENPHILVGACLKKEAVLSSKIEGTLASLKDLNLHDVLGSIDKKEADRLRLKEVVNYVNALDWSLNRMRSDRRVSLDLLRGAHKILMDGVGGQDLDPGNLRNIQNWIINTRGTTKTIIYTPPPPEKILRLLENLEEFLQKDHQNLSVLIQCAVAHYQFEAIHPFLDGNGRIGRLLLPLILHEKEIMPVPLLHMSAYFDRYRDQYYRGLLEVSQKSKWLNWIKFFLDAFIVQADEAIHGIGRMTDLMREYKELLRKRKASGKALLLMEKLFSNPYITIPWAAEFLGIRYPSAKNTIMSLVDAGILRNVEMRYKSKVFVADGIEEAIRGPPDTSPF